MSASSSALLVPLLLARRGVKSSVASALAGVTLTASALDFFLVLILIAVLDLKCVNTKAVAPNSIIAKNV